MMPAVRDHKRLYDGNHGPNTGGMGAYAPSPVMTPALAEQVRTRIIEPVLQGLQREKCCFKGVIYVGLLLTENGPLALELNTRLGDPGAQVVLPLLETDLLELLESCVNGTLDQMNIRWYNQAAVSIVLASTNYPERSDPGVTVHLPSTTPNNVILFHAGTRIAGDGGLITTGGRVIDVTGIGPNLPTALTLAYDAVQHIHFDGMQYRTDIGMRALWRDT
jgi:phosphoribosylamine--glycine ligase